VPGEILFCGFYGVQKTFSRKVFPARLQSGEGRKIEVLLKFDGSAFTASRNFSVFVEF
jgi:hypothetical protein